MAVVSLVATSYADSDSAALLIAPVYLGGDLESDAATWAMIGAAVNVLGFLTTEADSVSAIDVGILAALLLVMDADSDAGLDITTPAPAIVAIDGSADADSDTTLALAQGHALTPVSTADGDAALNVGQALLPVLRDPLPGEVAGVVNVVENPSVEAGLAGWSVATATLDRDDADPWVGAYAGEVAIASGAGTAEVVIRSVDQLAGAPITPWVGSVSIRGDALDVRPFLRFTYDDASTDGAFAGFRPWEPGDLGLLLLAMFLGDDLTLANLAQIVLWPDASGNGRDASGTAGSQRPTYDLANTAATFVRSSQQFLDVGGALSASTLNRTLAVVFDVGSTADEGTLIGGSGNGALALDIGTTGLVRLTKENLAIIGQSTNPVSTTGFHVVRGTAQATTWNVAVDGTQNGGSHAQTLTAARTATLGKHSGSEYADGKMKAAIIAEALALADAQRVDGWLAHRYGFAASLAAGHPYLTDAPLVNDIAAAASWVRHATDPAFPDETKTLRRIDLVVQAPQTGSTQTLYLDGAQIETASGGGATPYADGDQGEGAAWFGAPHASASYREPMLP